MVQLGVGSGIFQMSLCGNKKHKEKQRGSKKKGEKRWVHPSRDAGRREGGRGGKKKTSTGGLVRRAANRRKIRTNTTKKTHLKTQSAEGEHMAKEIGSLLVCLFRDWWRFGLRGLKSQNVHGEKMDEDEEKSQCAQAFPSDGGVRTFWGHQVFANPLHRAIGRG